MDADEYRMSTICVYLRSSAEKPFLPISFRPKLPLALAGPGLIDEYEFVVHPRLTGAGPTLFARLIVPPAVRKTAHCGLTKDTPSLVRCALCCGRV
jgi:hypothetical protein